LTLFRPCIDLHQGKVKQIVGGSLNQSGAETNFVSPYDAAHYAELYKQHSLSGGHVISLGPNNKQQALNALSAYPNKLQYGGGVTPDNANEFIEAGASHVIVTSYLFEQGQFSWARLKKKNATVGADRLVLDLSCRKTNDGWMIATDRWQTVTDTAINQQTISQLEQHCAEFLVHAADIEGLQAGIDQELVQRLGEICTLPCTYAGGAKSVDDLQLVNTLSNGKIDLTIGSALDIFGGSGVTLDECLNWNNQN
jgi:phosphoribosylformimino-5-aminoimidazole carboxamide ribotide isomerase